MNTQNTPVHVRLWHRDFWLLAFASLFLTMSVYVLIPILPRWLMDVENFSPEETGLSMGAFAVGLFLLGSYCSWLIEHYRRNVVCMWAIIAIGLDLVLLWYIDSLRSEFVEFGVILLQRLLLGAFFGLAQMVLSSTLIIDTCESFHRTEANHSATWFSRFALALGPLTGFAIYDYFGYGGVLVEAVVLAAVALLLVKAVTFPFRTPEEQLHMVSLDRFILPHGMVLFAHLLVVCLVVGMLLSLQQSMLFYGLMSGGFLLALLAQHFVFPDAELKSEIISGLLLLLAALLIMLVYPLSPVSPVLVGLSVGLIGSRFLLFFIKLSRHCKRGTSVSSYFLAWETGLTLGLAVGYGLLYNQPQGILYVAIVLTVLLLLSYHLYVHAWFLRNKNR